MRYDFTMDTQFSEKRNEIPERIFFMMMFRHFVRYKTFWILKFFQISNHFLNLENFGKFTEF